MKQLDESLGLAVARYLLPSIKLLMQLPKNNDFETYSVDSRFSEGKNEPVLSTGPVDLAKNFDQKPKPKTSVNRESTVLAKYIYAMEYNTQRILRAKTMNTYIHCIEVPFPFSFVILAVALGRLSGGKDAIQSLTAAAFYYTTAASR